MMTSPSWRAADRDRRGGWGSVYSPDVVVRVFARLDDAGRPIGLRDVLPLTGRWREALIARPNDLPSHIRMLLSAHRSGRHAAGLRAPAGHRSCRAADDGRLGVWRVDGAPARAERAVRAEYRTAHPQGATQWATVTAVAFDRHPSLPIRPGTVGRWRGWWGWRASGSACRIHAR
jgi:hypothetical protein